MKYQKAINYDAKLHIFYSLKSTLPINIFSIIISNNNFQINYNIYLETKSIYI